MGSFSTRSSAGMIKRKWSALRQTACWASSEETWAAALEMWKMHAIKRLSGQFLNIRVLFGILRLEMVQHRSARFLNSDYRRSASRSDMIKTLGLESFAERRKKSKIIMIDKINNNLIDIPKTLFKPVNLHGRRRNMIFHVPYCKSDTFRFSFTPSAANIWNSLSENIRNQKSLDSLKRALNGLK